VSNFFSDSFSDSFGVTGSGGGAITEGTAVNSLADPDDAEIVVTAPRDPLPLLLANDIATSLVMQDMILYGGVLGAAGADIAAILELMGFSRIIAGGIAGSISALGSPTSVAETLSTLQDNLHEIYRDRALADIEEHPERYQNWILINGVPFDASTLDD
jgi:hypothetical protein